MSRMVTTCANCRQQLAVTAADLRVGQGYVRCGRCDKVFNALLTLAEDEPAPTEPDSVAHGTRSVPALSDDDLPPIPGREREPLPFGSDDDIEVEVVQTHVTGQFRGIVMEGERGEARETDAAEDGQPPAAEPAPEGESGSDAGSDLASGTASDAGAAAGNETGTEQGDPPAAPPPLPPERDEVAREIIRKATSQPIDALLEEDATAADADVTGHPAPVEEEFDVDSALGRPPRRSGLWTLAAILLALLLLAQWAHHSRAKLVTVPWLTGPLQAVYGLFGHSVDPPWDLSRYEVQLLGAVENPGTPPTLVLQAAIAVNRDASWPQPPPVLRVALTDRWGNELGATDVRPREWLLGEPPARLTPGQRVDARITLPSREGVSGFSLLPCLPDDDGALRCHGAR